MLGIIKRTIVFLAIIIIFSFWSIYGKEYCDFFTMAYFRNGFIGNYCEIKIIKNVVIFLSFLVILIDVVIFFVKRACKNNTSRRIVLIVLVLLIIGGVGCYLINNKSIQSNQVQLQN